MPTDTAAKPRRHADTTAARAAALATFARRRAERAIAELERQGYTVIPPQPGP